MNEPLVRIVRGSLTAEEMAALTAVLAARAAVAAATSAAPVVEPVATWSRIERRPAYFSPVSWQQAA
ncbi:acyl-CoA carboxylase subunit epsilon [Kitasatospora sp. NA04385]|uniref:acyl-CoA carboxylase epsilon subunit n=1 Tax=Kitasatospora sp. NA04385 TaxID=2742135 RepID=UPI0015911576|nr:acyl-CoA carboxylase epsilon subunit [Kitasatospora sp. NA04385]QKW20070.1 acyl-CoA carboxylase subunit epsilon [Kitasatospora sp. NA04385]